MRQVIHIFCKDARRCWPYVALVLALTAMTAVLTPKSTPVNPPGFSFDNMVELLTLLLPAAWWLTIARLVHGDSLVGDRQFWLTRPYSWKSLFGAKFLFCAVFLWLPFFLSDLVILRAADFSPANLAGALLVRYCALSSFLIVTPFVLACITRNSGQFVLACLLLVIGFACAAELQQFHPRNDIVEALQDSVPGEKSWLQLWGAVLAYATIGSALMLWQYTRRQTAAARTAVILLVVGLLADAAWPGSIVSAFGRRPSDRHPEVAVVFAPARTPHRPGIDPRTKNKVQVDLPIELTGQDRDLLDLELASISFEPEHGAPWTTSWSWYNHTLEQGGADWVEVLIDLRDFQRLSGQMVTVRAVFAVVVYEAQSRVPLRGDKVWTPVPGFGSVLPDRMPERGAYLWFRTPLREGPERFVSSIQGPDSTVLVRAQHDGSYPPGADLFHFSPVICYAALFERPGDHRFDIALPTDIHGDFVLLRPVALVRRDLVIPRVNLADYSPANDVVNDFK
jgi:hypothetical protein